MTLSTGQTELPPPGSARGVSKSHLKSTAKHGGIYALGTMLSRLASVIMLPVYTRVLTVEDYGVLEILGLTTDVLSTLAGLGVGMAVTRFYYLYETDRERNAVVSTAWVTLTGLYALLAIAAVLSADSLSRALLGPGQRANLIFLAVTALVMNMMSDMPLIYFRARQESFVVAASSVARLLISLSLNIVLVVHFRLGVAGVLWSTITSSCIVGAILVVRMLRVTGIRFEPRITRQLASFGLPLMTAQLGSFVLHFSDRYFLRVFTSLAVVGVYSVSYKFAWMLSMFVSAPFKSIWIPKALDIARSEGEAAVTFLKQILAYYNLLLVSAALAIALFTGDVIRLVAGPAFSDASRPIPVLVLAMVFFGLRSVSQIGSLIAKDSRSIAVSSTVAALAVLVLNATLIPVWGVMGAAVATLAGFALEFFVMRRLSERKYPLNLSIATILLPLAVASTAWAVGVLASGGLTLAPRLVVRLLAFFGYLVSLRAVGLLSSADVRHLREAATSPLSFVRSLRGA